MPALDPHLMTKFAADGVPLLAPRSHAAAVIEEVGDDAPTWQDGAWMLAPALLPLI